MAMNYHLAKILFMQKKVFSNPEKVTPGLQLQRNSGSYSRVREKKIAAGKRERKASQKTMMAVGHGLTKRNCDLMLRLRIVAVRRDLRRRRG